MSHNDDARHKTTRDNTRRWRTVTSCDNEQQRMTTTMTTKCSRKLLQCIVNPEMWLSTISKKWMSSASTSIFYSLPHPQIRLLPSSWRDGGRISTARRRRSLSVFPELKVAIFAFLLSFRRTENRINVWPGSYSVKFLSSWHRTFLRVYRYFKNVF